MSKGLHQRTVFAGCARDCAASLPCVLANLAQMATLFEEAAFIFVEDGSVDDTRDLLLAWCRNRPQARVISADSQSPLRTVRLAAARNAYTALARTEFGHFDYLIALDMDEVNVAGFAPDALPRALDFLDGNGLCAGVFANTDGFYYDMWALRQREQCPGDVWEEVCDRVLATGASDEAAYDATLHRRIFHLPPDAAPLAVDSAFGGFGLYRMSSLLANTREFVGERRKILPPPMAARVAFADAGGAVGWQCCEHVTFHAGLRENGGQLFILPYLINYRSAFRDFNPQAWRGLLFDLRPSVPLPAGSIARNQSCPCGSGRRYKHCHGALG